jgi:hypothetical protein
MSKDFLLIHLDLEFNFNGYAIIRKDGFDSLKRGKFRRWGVDSVKRRVYGLFLSMLSGWHWNDL